MSLDRRLQEQIETVLERLREPLGLDRWTLHLEVGRIEHRATCSAEPDYREATLTFDPERLQTGDELEEIVAHEATHCLVSPLARLAARQSASLVAVLPEEVRSAYASLLDQGVEDAEERVTTDVGHAILRLARRLWRAEAEIVRLRAEARRRSGAPTS